MTSAPPGERSPNLQQDNTVAAPAQAHPNHPGAPRRRPTTGPSVGPRSARNERNISPLRQRIKGYNYIQKKRNRTGQGRGEGGGDGSTCADGENKQADNGDPERAAQAKNRAFLVDVWLDPRGGRDTHPPWHFLLAEEAKKVEERGRGWRKGRKNMGRERRWEKRGGRGGGTRREKEEGKEMGEERRKGEKA